MEISKASAKVEDFIVEWHWEIFWDIVGLQCGYTVMNCPNCKGYADWIIKHSQSLRCSRCKKQYSPLSKTLFANTKIYLPFWFKAILFLRCNPTSTLEELRNELKCTNVTACRIRQKVKLMKETGIEIKIYKKHYPDIIRLFDL